MLNSDFENKVRQQMEELKLNASEAVWENIDRELAQNKKPRRWLLYFVLLALLTGGLLFTWNSSKDTQKQISESSIDENKLTTAHEPIPGKKEPAVVLDTAAYNTTAAILPRQNTASVINSNSSMPTMKPAIKTGGGDADVTPGHKRSSIIVKQASGARATVIAAQASDDTNEQVTAASTFGGSVDRSRTTNIGKEYIALASRYKLAAPLIVHLAVSNFPDSITSPERPEWGTVFSGMRNKRIDTMVSTIVNTRTRQTVPGKWQYAINIGGGISNIVNGLFQNKPVLADAIGNTSSGGVTGPSNAVRPNDPSASGAFTAGLQVEKSIGKKWKFISGLQYMYQSSVVKTGSRVDSSATFNMGNGSISADNFYLPGSMQRYRNKSHFLHVPLLFQFRLSKKYPAYVEAGPGISYLLRSNVLLYNSRRSAYYSNSEAFNNLLLSFTAGAGFELNRHKQIPFRLGYRFSYGISSISKASFGNQQLQASLLYLSIPIKK